MTGCLPVPRCTSQNISQSIIDTKFILSVNLHTSTVQTVNFFYSRPDVLWVICQKNKPNTWMTHIACESKLLSLVRSSMHSWQGSWVAIGHAVVYSTWAAHAFSAGIKCLHCTSYDIFTTISNLTIMKTLETCFVSVTTICLRLHGRHLCCTHWPLGVAKSFQTTTSNCLSTALAHWQSHLNVYFFSGEIQSLRIEAFI